MSLFISCSVKSNTLLSVFSLSFQYKTLYGKFFSWNGNCPWQAFFNVFQNLVICRTRFVTMFLKIPDGKRCGSVVRDGLPSLLKTVLSGVLVSSWEVCWCLLSCMSQFCCLTTWSSRSSRDLGRITYPTMPAWKRTNSGGSLLDTCVRFHVSGSFYVAKVSRAFSTNLKKNITHDKFYWK